MAELTPFAYLPGDSLLHRLDVRVKLLGVLGISAVGLRVEPLGLLFLSLFLVILMAAQRLPLGTMLRQLRLFGWFLLLVWISRALTTPGTPWLSWGPIHLSRPGVIEGALICCRLVLTLAVGLLFAAGTRPSQLKAACHWLLRWIPGIPAGRVAVMVGLVMRFFPLILQNAQEIRAAQQARCIQHRKNPIFRARTLAVALLRKTFLTADELALAMEARCYTSQRSDPSLDFQRRDWGALATLALLLVPLLVA
ncbi:MAG: energy-coupling factor transporter transmembrane component T [Desulfobacterales bacterium]